MIELYQGSNYIDYLCSPEETVFWEKFIFKFVDRYITDEEHANYFFSCLLDIILNTYPADITFDKEHVAFSIMENCIDKTCCLRFCSEDSSEEVMEIPVKGELFEKCVKVKPLTEEGYNILTHLIYFLNSNIYDFISDDSEEKVNSILNDIYRAYEEVVSYYYPRNISIDTENQKTLPQDNIYKDLNIPRNIPKNKIKTVYAKVNFKLLDTLIDAAKYLYAVPIENAKVYKVNNSYALWVSMSAKNIHTPKSNVLVAALSEFSCNIEFYSNDCAEYLMLEHGKIIIPNNAITKLQMIK